MELKKRYDYIRYSASIDNIDNSKTFYVYDEVEIGYGSFENALIANQIKFEDYKIVAVDTHYNVMGLIDGEWVKLKVCKTYNGGLMYIKEINEKLNRYVK